MAVFPFHCSAGLRRYGVVITLVGGSMCSRIAASAANLADTPAPNPTPAASNPAPAINPILLLPPPPASSQATTPQGTLLPQGTTTLQGTLTPTPSAAGTPTPPGPKVTIPVPKQTPAPVYEDVSHESLRTALNRLKLPLPLPAPRIVVTKSQRRLELFSGQTLVKSYRVALGAQPTGAKQTQGDGRTPEGQFYICTRNASNSAFHIFLGLSYPALPDATRAVNSKAITWREYQVIRQRLASRGAPLWQTHLGGWVGIHGGTGGTFAQKRTAERRRPDWTAGCIAVTDAEINEIYSATGVGTSVVVRP